MIFNLYNQDTPMIAFCQYPIINYFLTLYTYKTPFTYLIYNSKTATSFSKLMTACHLNTLTYYPKHQHLIKAYCFYIARISSKQSNFQLVE